MIAGNSTPHINVWALKGYFQNQMEAFGSDLPKEYAGQGDAGTEDRTPR